MTVLLILLTAISPPWGGDADPSPLIAPDTLNLVACYTAAEEHFPLMRRAAIAERVAHLEQQNINSRFRPSVELESEGVYHSAVPELPIQSPGVAVPDIPHDQYRAELNVHQVLYDGGAGSTERRIANATARTTSAEVDVALHELKARINDAFFSALLQGAALASLEVLRDEIEVRRESILVRVREGVVTGEAVDALDVELLSIEQRIESAEHARRGALAALSAMTGLSVSDDVVLLEPDDDVLSVRNPSANGPMDMFDAVAHHPQYRAFEATRERLVLQRELAGRSVRPRVGALAMGALGRPAGMDIFEDRIRPYFSVGVRMTWSLWDWGASSRSQSMLTLQEEVVDARADAFSQEIQAQAVRTLEDVQRIRALIRRDRDIEALRARIADRAAERLENGVITATDYLIEQHAEHRAMLARRQHEIELRYTLVRYHTILGLIDEIL